MVINFGDNGFIKPYEVISCDIPTLEKYFVDAFPNSKTRYQLYINYRKYTEDLKSRVSQELVQWINGSFISKKQNPNDIDLVTFIPYKLYEVRESYLENFWTFNREDEGLDSYLVKWYPEEHHLNHRTREQMSEWQKTYRFTKPNNDDVKFPKGFLQLKFT